MGRDIQTVSKGEAAAAWAMEAGDAERLGSYLRRGRRFESLSTAELNAAYKDGMRLWSDDPTDAPRRGQLDDARAEFNLRQSGPILDEECKAYFRRVMQAVEDLVNDKERAHEVNEQIMADYAAAQQRRN